MQVAFIGTMSIFLQKEREMCLVGQRFALHNLVNFHAYYNIQDTLFTQCCQADKHQNCSGKQNENVNYGEREGKVDFVPKGTNLTLAIYLKVGNTIPDIYTASSDAIGFSFQTPDVFFS